MCALTDRYADASGNSLAAADDYGTYPSVAACTYLGNDGEEEMYIFFSLAWFDLGSWAWAHYIAEWGTKGIFAVSMIPRWSQFLVPVLNLPRSVSGRGSSTTIPAPESYF